MIHKVKPLLATAFAALLAFVVGSSAWGQSRREEIIRVRTLPLNVDLRPQPQLVTTDADQRVMAYVVFITSWADYNLTFARIDVEDANSGAVLASYDRKALEDPARLRTTRFITSKASPGNRVLPAGRTAILYIILPVTAGSTVPKALRHRFTFEPDDKLRIVRDDGSLTTELVAVSEPVPVNPAAVPVLGPPLEGGPWRCGNGLALGNSHTSLYSFRTAQMRVPQLFGCDLLKVDSGGNILPSPFPNQITASMFYGYGAKVLAVADGRVVVAHDGIPESTPQVSGEVSMPVPLTNATVAGNWIALDIGGGRYAFYAHFQPGSLRVKVGDRVRAGQVLGLVGMAGNAVNPHLHFHVGNAPSLNGSDGEPYVFRDYVFEGRSVPDKTAARRVERRVPVENSLLTFPSAKP
ncbi:MAG TPA: M23 family metallopeptidase [Gemmatimonadales bacterium]|nr:M23 family metallopeptidase [Gemmatimonadales bacterium]